MSPIRSASWPSNVGAIDQKSNRTNRNEQMREEIPLRVWRACDPTPDATAGRDPSVTSRPITGAVTPPWAPHRLGLKLRRRAAHAEHRAGLRGRWQCRSGASGTRWHSRRAVDGRPPCPSRLAARGNPWHRAADGRSDTSRAPGPVPHNTAPLRRLDTRAVATGGKARSGRLMRSGQRKPGPEMRNPSFTSAETIRQPPPHPSETKIDRLPAEHPDAAGPAN